MLRMTQRRAMVEKAKRAGEARIKRAIEPLFARRFAALKRELRRSNLRKRLGKSAGLYKDNGAEWANWEEEFLAALTEAMLKTIDELFAAENEFWTSRGKEPMAWDSKAVIERYQTRIGRKIRDIPDGTLNDVQDEIARWFGSEETLPDLIDSLGQYFDPARAEMIAITEATALAAQAAYEMMNHFGIRRWRWDAILDAVVCPDCAERNGVTYDVEDSDNYPPAHPRCRCGEYFLEED